MLHLLLPIIYLAFIGLGLPDSLLGSAWPAMYEELGAPLRSAGVVGMIISVGTIVSSLMSGRVDITVSESHRSDHDGATSPMKVSHRSGGMEPVFRRGSHPVSRVTSPENHATL